MFKKLLEIILTLVNGQNSSSQNSSSQNSTGHTTHSHSFSNASTDSATLVIEDAPLNAGGAGHAGAVSDVVSEDICEEDHLPASKNRTMMQGFEWYLPADGSHWNRISSQAKELAKNGINMLWLPPAYKGMGGMSNVGYSVYDTYDLGEFDQQGSVLTKYGSKDDYLACCQTLKDNGIEIIADIVLNHRMGADGKDTCKAWKVEGWNRDYKQSDLYEIEPYTRFEFNGRNGKYSDFKWNYTHFTGVDYDGRTGENGVFLFEGKHWDDQVDNENGNYDYLMGADIDLENPEVMQELIHFGKWYYDMTGLDGFRLDAVKHMCAGFYRDWIAAMREYTGKEMFSVGEFWSADLWKLQSYIHQTEGAFSLFDVPLHMHFYEISNANSGYDMRKLFENTLTGTDSWHSVTFVDNHDTQPGQALGTFVADWFKEIAYAIILLQEKGIPCVFYGDYYGITDENDHSHDVKPVFHLKTLTSLRATHAYGPENDYYDDPNIVGFTREGTCRDNGLAVIISDGAGGRKWMYVGKRHAGQTYYDALGHCTNAVTISAEGFGEFYVNGGSVSVWVPQ